MNMNGSNYFQINNRRYLGNKQKMLEFIKDVVKEHCSDIYSVADLFGGTGVVSHAFNTPQNKIIINDILYSNYLSYLTWFGNQEIDKNKIKDMIHLFNNQIPINENYMSINFGGTYFTEHNARKIGYIREEISKLKYQLTPREEAILITSLIYATDKVANTFGHYEAYKKSLDKINEIELHFPKLNDYKNKNNEIYQKDANELVHEISADLFYIDTPYNSRQYSDTYHLLENIAEWKKPDLIGKTKKMINRNHIKSKYCTVKAKETFFDLIKNIKGKYILISYSNMENKGNSRSNAKISSEEIMHILQEKGNVQTFEFEHPIYNTGKTNINNHKEILYLCTIGELYD